ncbi:MAG: DUF3320 domain-containing protein [Planctomycetes bacterium]|nr:DUF3320 domain-containing protein [Planctomycetota bacterium]
MTEAMSREIRTEAVEVDLAYDPRVNYAMQQNAVPVVKTVRIRNAGPGDLEELRVALWAEPTLAPRFEIAIDRIPAGAAHALDRVDLPLSAAKLVNQEERESGELWIEIARGDEILHRTVHPIEVLAYSEWAGGRSLPEILAAFVLPNHPEVEKLLRAAGERLQAATGDSSIAGYQTRDPVRARAIVAAIHDAACALGLSYVNPPASFETAGQKVRTPDRLAASGMGTCLDLVLFVAAAIEQAGLNPLLILLDGHAILGAWLEDENFLDAVVDEMTRIRKRVEIGSIVAVETTGITGRPPASFDEAARAGERALQDRDRFQYAVDVRAARKARILPLPPRTAEPAHRPVPESGATAALGSAPRAGEPAPPPPPAPHAAEPAAETPPGAGARPATPAGRVGRWKQKLLDLTLRNRLLNFRSTKKAIPIICPDAMRLEDLLAAGKTFTVHPEPHVMGGTDPRDADLHRSRTGEDPVESFLRAEMEEGRLHANLTQEELDERLVEIDRAARLSLEEGGANTLYLAVGFLRWYETPSSTLVRAAPILLLPLALQRKSVLEGYHLRLADDDPRINITLLEKLRVDFDVRIEGLEELETDESGLAVRTILDKMRRAILPLDRWEVTEEVTLGLFSFTKYLMWLDLEDRADDLRRNDVVRHLIETPGEAFDADAPFPDPARLDAERDPAETFCPLDADSSQLAAIHAAADGRTFVLEGPPGTGKSQTIANLIAHSLAAGKRVLFVSEKMAALNVVFKRLAVVGLGPFCLELHSNKAQKGRVLDQIKQALEFIGGDGGGEDWIRTATRLRAARDALNAYAETLHRPRCFGRSAFDGLAASIALREAPRVPLDFGPPDAVDRDRFEALEEAIRKLGVAIDEVGAPGASPWRAARVEEWTPALAREVGEACGALAEAAERLGERAKALADAMGFDAPLSRRAIDALVAVGGLLARSPAPPRELLSEPDWEGVRARVGQWIEIGRARNALAASLDRLYRRDLLRLDLADLRGRLAVAAGVMWPFSWIRSRGPRRALAVASLRPKLPPNREVVEEIDRAIDLRAKEDAIAGLEGEGRALLGRAWRGLETDWDELAACVEWAGAFRAAVASAPAADLDALRRLRDRWITLAVEGKDLFREDGAIGRALRELETSRDECTALRGRLDACLALDGEAAWADAEEPPYAARLAANAAAWSGALPALRAWCAYARARRGSCDAGLAAIVEAVEDGRIARDDLDAAFRRSFFQWWIDGLLAAEPVLRAFHGIEQRDRIRTFRDLDIHLTEIAHDVIRGTLAERVPRGAAAARGSGSEMGILERELAKQRRHLSIRRLFRTIPNVLCRLKPCMLMSPLSVAQYLTTDFPAFDLVVFDEASQIPVWDAVGAIARGSRLVVVGDSKQLPPTNFFMRTESDEIVDEDEIEEMESILDECIVARLPRLHLGWHYRSRHETLIAFSNAHYYDGKLLTFPSAARESPALGVKWRPVEGGLYDRGKSRANRIEAEAVVEEVVRRLLDPEASRHTIGIVTFSIAQQTLVEDLLDDARRRHPEIERFFGDAIEEPVFIKNLENVQGDERDVILFSICYGPDQQGRVSLNYGPINREGGERRLNVAITRAREQVIVFSSIRAELIDLARTKSIGVMHLKGFLEYAERGGRMLATPAAADAGTPSAFERAVRKALEGRGWMVEPRVGFSGYRVDLGVRDPEEPDRFLAGIECDGAMYASGRTARDRDRLRAAVLESLGWRLLRVWSVDWLHDPAGEIERLAGGLEEARRARAGERAARTVPGDAEGGGPARSDLFARLPKAGASKEDPAEDPRRAPTEDEAEERGTPSLGGIPYEAADLGRPVGSPEEFHEKEAEAWIRREIDEILAQEAPVALERLLHRVAACWGVGRVTQRVRERILAFLPADVARTRGEEDEFLWREGQDPATHAEFRIPAEGEDAPRSAEEIPPEEIACAAEAILRIHVAMPRTELAREGAKVFGISRLGSIVERCMDAGIQLLVERGRAAAEDESIRLP